MTLGLSQTTEGGPKKGAPHYWSLSWPHFLSDLLLMSVVTVPVLHVWVTGKTLQKAGQQSRVTGTSRTVCETQCRDLGPI